MILVDALAVCYRAHYALQGKRRDRRGFDVGAREMVKWNLGRLVERGEEVHLAWDCVGQRTFRHGLFPAYKAHRKEMPGPLAGQLPEIRDDAKMLGCTHWHAPGFEADDALATLASMLDPAPVQVFSPDKDMLQIVTERVHCAWFDRDTVYNWKEYGPAEVEEKMGVPPALVPDLLALTGDACDGIGGLPGVGPKRAVALLKKMGSAKAVDCGTEERAQAVALALQLVTLRSDAPVEVI